MKTTTGILKLATHKIECPKWDEPIHIVPFGDVHRHAPMCNVKKWKRSLEKMKQLPNAYFLGMGDYDDLMSASERAAFTSPKFHESTRETLDDFAKSKTFALAKELDFMRGRLIGLVGGNHFYPFQNGTDSDQLLCDHLDCPYLGVSAMIRLQFSVKKGGGKGMSVDMWAHHGKGASRLIGGSINRVEQMREALHADVYLMGHDHRRAAVPLSIMELTSGRNGLHLKYRKQWLCRTGSFLNAYSDGEESYIVEACKGPVDLGYIVLTMTPTRDRTDGRDVCNMDIHALI